MATLIKLRQLQQEGASNLDLIRWNTSTSKWEPSSMSSILGSGSANQVAYWSGSGTTLTGNAGLTFDGTTLTVTAGSNSTAFIATGLTKTGTTAYTADFGTSQYVVTTTKSGNGIKFINLDENGSVEVRADAAGAGNIKTGLSVTGSYAVSTSGIGYYTTLSLTPVINQTGTANAITRGLYINPTLTSAVDFRALEIASAGKAIYQSSTGATNNLAGSTSIGATTTPSRTLHVFGTMRLSTDAGTPTSVLGKDSNGDISTMTQAQAATATLPTQTGNSGKYLTTNGTNVSWATVSAGVTGSGTTNRIPLWTSSSAIGNSIITQSGTASITISSAQLFVQDNDNTGAHNTLHLTNSSSNILFGVGSDGVTYFGNNGTYPNVKPANGIGTLGISETGLGIQASVGGTTSTSGLVLNNIWGTYSSGQTYSALRIIPNTFAPSGTTTAFNGITLDYTINQTGGSTGITRGIHINPSLSSAYDFRAIEIGTSAGKGIYQSGGATNHFVGKTIFGSTGTPDSSAVIELSSTTAGLLVPRMTTTQVNAISTPADGLIVYDSTTASFKVRQSGAWTPLSTGGAAGTVTSVSVVSANGLAGTVANASTTPAITLSTTITGILKGNGTSISAATSGSDYAPATSGSSILYGNGAGGFSNATATKSVTLTGGSVELTSDEASPTGSKAYSTNYAGTKGWNNISSDIIQFVTASGTSYSPSDKSPVGRMVLMTNSSANTFTIPTNASVPFEVGTQIHVSQNGTGQTTFVGAGGVTLVSANSKTKTRVRYSTVTLLKTATDTWLLFGDITT